ncbi:MAG: type II toxin-antitoxin system VapC family toxin [Pseudomonadales bacterium]|nr:type II toxin-antitoxin system VapC family toxin [Pseudomonadales bacterium]MCP5182361.1 type II toxin-antitoxin system VapC family toxin [Pseudomonadales bacterium]
MILLDTHVLVWLDQGVSTLGPLAREAIQRTFDSAAVGVSAISFWEVAMLEQRGRLALARSVVAWRGALLAAGVRELPLTGDIGARAVELDGLLADPADRFILATALAEGATLVTADERLLTWRGPLQRVDARV